jgi:hypothetical protein
VVAASEQLRKQTAELESQSLEQQARHAAIATSAEMLQLASSTVKSLIIENGTPIENGDFERFLAFRLARIGIFL